MNNFDWAEGMACAVTAADKDGVITYMNRRAREQYKKHGDLIGRSLYDCHGERAAGIIRRLLAEGGTNAYTIEKNGVRKMIYQTAVTAADGRKVIKLGINFSRETKTIDKWIAEEE